MARRKERLIEMAQHRFYQARLASEANDKPEMWVHLLAMQMDVSAAQGELQKDDIIQVARAAGLTP